MGDAFPERRQREDFLSRLYFRCWNGNVCLLFRVFFTRKEFDVELALKSSIKTMVLFLGILSGILPANEHWVSIFKRVKI
jgi:hypothetical protein